MTQIHQIPILIPLLVSTNAVVATTIVHALAVSVTLKFIRLEKRFGRVGASFRIDVAIVALTILFALVAHLISIALWAVLFLICGEFPAFGPAFYHSAVNYTTLGYGDVIMSPSWRLLGPLEGANGTLMFGVSTAMIFALIQWLAQARLGPTVEADKLD